MDWERDEPEELLAQLESTHDDVTFIMVSHEVELLFDELALEMQSQSLPRTVWRIARVWLRGFARRNAGSPRNQRIIDQSVRHRAAFLSMPHVRNSPADEANKREVKAMLRTLLE